MKTKITYIISDIHKSLAFEWIAEALTKEKFELNFILLNKGDSHLESYLKENHIPVNRINYAGKYDIPKAFIQLCFFLLKKRPQAIHAHLFDASLLGLTAAWVCRIKKRIYTRHHSTYHHDYFPKAIKYDKLCNRLATHIVSISKNVSKVLIQKEKVAPSKISLIHHGFKLDLFLDVPETKVNTLKQKYSTNASYPVIGVISRYTEWKGIQYIIPAFKKLLSEYPKAKLILAGANGDYEKHIKALLKEIPNENKVEITFENDLFALYKLFDVFVHVPIDPYSEAFGQVYIEALASSVPSIFTLSGIANDFIRSEENALVVNFKHTEGIYLALKKILEDKTLAVKQSKQGLKDVQELFPLTKMINELENLYLL